MTNKYRSCLFLLCLISLYAVELSAQNCNCLKNLDSLVKSIERNYVGFEEKVTAENKLKYNLFKDSLYLKAGNAQDFNCYLLLRNYVDFFQDPHLSIFIDIASISSDYRDSLVQIFSTFPKISVNEEKIKTYLSKPGIDKIEGIWQTGADNSLAIYKPDENADRYIGVTLKGNNITWFPGQVKLEVIKEKGDYMAKVYRADHLPKITSCIIDQNKLILSGNGIYRRMFPTTTFKSLQDSPILGLKKLSKDCNLLYLRDSWINFKKPLDSLVNTNMKLLTSTKYLIIDIRNNSGGHIMTFDTLMSLLCTNPIKRDGFIIKSTEDNISLYKTGLNDPSYSLKDINAFESIITKMENNIGKLVKIYESDSTDCSKEYVFPKKVAILTNRGTGSAAELFLLWAKQSKKVIICGINSKGALDHTEIVAYRNLPCPYVKYFCPMGMNEHKVYPYIDNTGISPDMDLSNENGDWVDLIKGYLEKLE